MTCQKITPIGAFLATVLLAISPSPLRADDQNPKISQNPAGYSLDWSGNHGRTYFVQMTTNLQQWHYFPEIYSGDGSLLSHGFNTNAPRLFTRLIWTDLPDGGDPSAADFDNDGLATQEELTSAERTDPLNPDTDGDGLRDGWERTHGFNPVSTDSDGNGTPDGAEDPDGDGANNETEQNNDSDPNNAERPRPRGGFSTLPLLLVEIRDVKGSGDSDDVTIQNWNGNNPIPPASIAWIEPHLAANDSPQMPQLEFRILGLPDIVKVEAKVKVVHERSYFAQATNKKDEVEFPAGGGFKELDGDSWKIWEDYKDEPFFGGEAVLTYKVEGGAEQTIKFRIGGKNPDDPKCKAYIETIQDAGPQGSLWFAYAIAKHESKGYNAGAEGVYYNQFMALPRHPRDNGLPVHVRAETSGAGGVGIIQVTGKGGNKNVDAGREIFWNWQENLNQGVSIVRSKKTIVDVFWPRQFNASNANGTALPPITLSGVLFKEGTNRKMYHLLIMKAYNGAGRVIPHHNSNPVEGFTLDTTFSGHFSYWHNDRNSWGLNQFARFDPNKPPNNYASKVCHEID